MRLKGVIELKEKISASEVSSHEYCELQWYYEETGKDSTDSLEEERNVFNKE